MHLAYSQALRRQAKDGPALQVIRKVAEMGLEGLQRPKSREELTLELEDLKKDLLGLLEQ